MRGEWSGRRAGQRGFATEVTEVTETTETETAKKNGDAAREYRRAISRFPHDAQRAVFFPLCPLCTLCGQPLIRVVRAFRDGTAVTCDPSLILRSCTS